MNIQFEKATADDAKKLLDVQIRAFHHDEVMYPDEPLAVGGPPDYDSLDVMLDDIEKQLCYKMVLDGVIIGGITIFNRGGGHYHLHIIHIDPLYHNKGIGSQAMRFIEANHPASKWTLDTPWYATRNQHFYEKLGYIKVGETTESDGFILFSYEKVMMR